MLEKLLKDWKGELQIDDKHYTNVEAFLSDSKRILDDTHIKLYSTQKNVLQRTTNDVRAYTETAQEEYKITVKKYMTEHASPGFDFMKKFNNDNPMPMRTMVGTIEKETRGMVYMNLRGEGRATVKCMRCGRTLTNPISMKYGIGPECMSKLGFVCDINDVDSIKLGLTEIKWKGWVIKSAILEKEIV